MSRYHPYKNNKSYGDQGKEGSPSEKKDETAVIEAVDSSSRFLHNYKRHFAFKQVFTSFCTITNDLSYFPGEVSLSSYLTDLMINKVNNFLIDGMFTKITIVRKPIKLKNIIVIADNQAGSTTPQEVSSFVQQGKVMLFPLTRKENFTAPGFILANGDTAITHPISDLICGTSHATRRGLLPIAKSSGDFRAIQVCEMMSYPHAAWNTCLCHEVSQTSTTSKADYHTSTLPNLTEGIPRGVYLFPSYHIANMGDTMLLPIVASNVDNPDVPTVPIKNTLYQSEVYLKDFPYKHLESNTEYEISGERRYCFTNALFEIKDALNRKEVTHTYSVLKEDFSEKIPTFIPWRHLMADTKKADENLNEPSPYERLENERSMGGIHLVTMLPITNSSGQLMQLRASCVVQEEVEIFLEGEEIATHIDNVNGETGPTALSRVDPDARYLPPLQVGVLGASSTTANRYTENCAFFLS